MSDGAMSAPWVLAGLALIVGAMATALYAITGGYVTLMETEPTAYFLFVAAIVLLLLGRAAIDRGASP